MRKILTKSEQKKIDKYEAIVKEEVDKLDPIGLLAMDCPKDEYKSEIQSISLRIDESWSRESGHNFLKLAEIMYIVFAYQFDIAEAGNVAKYVNTAGNIIKEIEKKRTDAISDMENKYPMLYRRHKRTVMAYPEGAIAHDGDCGIYRPFRICTCGLHHELMIIPDEAVKIYPKYWDEQDGMVKVDMLMNIEASDGGLWVKCDECAGQGGIGEIECVECKGKGLIPFKMPEPISNEKAKKLFNEIFGQSGDEEIIDGMFDKKDEEDPDTDSEKIPEN